MAKDWASMNLNLTTATRYGLNVLALLGISFALYLGRSIIIPLTIAAMLAGMLYPSAQRLHLRYRLPWFFACLSTVLIMVIFGLVIFAGFALAIPSLVADLPNPNNPDQQIKLYERLRAQVKNLPFDATGPFPENANNSAFFQYVKKTLEGDYITKALLDVSKFGGELLFQGVLIVFILLFLLLEGEMLARKIRNIFGPGIEVQSRVTNALGEIANSVRAYLFWRTLINVGLGVFLAIVYYFVGLNQWLLWALLTMVLSYVPYLGTIAAGVPPVLDAILSPNLGPMAALGVMVFYTAVVTFEGYLIVPWLMGRSMDLNATTVIISCLYWDYVWGTAGLFLAMPLMAAIKAVCLQVDGWKPWGQLMGSAEAQEQEPEAESMASDATVIMESPVIDKSGKPKA
jgi:AI-2 transport protein TqsA